MQGRQYSTCNGRWGRGVHGPWGKWGHIECRGRRGTRPAKRGGKWTVGIGQWRRLDTFKMFESSKDGLGTTRNQPYAQSMIICVICVLICHTPDNCNRELCLAMPICFRRINHMAVENHLHSSSGVWEVVSGTVPIFMCWYFLFSSFIFRKCLLMFKYHC
jgi:hypothetical protein